MNNSGYTSIVINDEEIELRFGIPAVRMFLEKIASSDVVINEDSINETGIANLLYFGYVNNCMVKDIIPNKTFGFFLQYVEESYCDEDISKKLEHVAEVYSESKYTKKMLENARKGVEALKKKNSK